jgi:serine/threonine-protein kinase
MCTKQSDVFSMGVVLWECLAGRRLFRGDEAVDTLQEVMHAPIPLLRRLGAHIPPALDDVIARALSRDMSVRFASAESFADAIVRSAGRGNVGTCQDVARAVETIFGPRMAKRHEAIRQAIGDEAVAARLFQASGLASRPKPLSTASHSPLALLAAISPPAPSERYSFGKPSEDYGLVAEKKARRNVATGVAVGVAVGMLVALLALAHAPPRVATASLVDPAPGSANGTSPLPLPEPTTRRVVVPLPIRVVAAQLDDLAREVNPAADTVVFSVPRESGFSHRVLATAADGTRAEGIVHEFEGVARIEGSDFAIVPAPPSTASSAKARPLPRSPPTGRVRNGFTTLP